MTPPHAGVDQPTRNHDRLPALSRVPSLVLLVERDPHVRELQTHFLVAAGYEVRAVTDGHAALEQAIALKPAIVITEILVPKLDGLSLCRQLKANSKTAHIAVVVFSILAAHARASEAGADAFLMKPLAKEHLLGVVHKLTQLRAAASAQESR